MQITHLRTETLENPLGLDALPPRLSWRMESDRQGAKQIAYQVVARISNSRTWDSAKVESNHCIHLPFGGELHSRDRVEWTVRVWDETGAMTESAPATFEMGLLDPSDWQAKWIGNSIVGGPRTTVPAPFLRREFTLNGKIQSARLYITALGVYEATLNGARIGQDVFSPGWTNYHRRVQYQTYDVTSMLAEGANMLGVVLGDGWYCGHVSWTGRQQYGDRPKLLAQLEITFTDGSSQVIVSDEAWRTAVGPILEADMLMGEAYDARLQLPSLTGRGVGGEGANWLPVVTFPHPAGLELVAQNTPTVHAQEEITPITDPQIVWGWPDFDWIFDFGQNLVGRVRLKVKGVRGTTLTLKFGEILDENGKLYTQNLRTARQTDYYTLSGDPDGEIWESRFTFHGFRYVQVNGLVDEPPSDLLTAIVLHSDNTPALEFECSEPLINQLQHNITWGWKGNSLDLPTDCPQRDERLGWTGDAQVFARTACYLTDSAGFFTKWIRDMADAQLPYGAIPAVAPVITTLEKADGGSAWSDAFIIVPWTVWQHYGDTRVLETFYPAMRRYMDYLVEYSPGLIRCLPGEQELGKINDNWMLGGFGDWLAQDGGGDLRGLTPKDLIGTAYLAYDAKLMSQMAAALGKTDDSTRFARLFDETCAAFTAKFITHAGELTEKTQTGHVLALHFGLVPENLRPQLADWLIQDIENRQTHMSTGFVGTSYLCQALTDAGRLDLAYALLLQKTYPSWLYSVLHGATTIWERWDGWTEEKGFQDPGMNSFNHYAYGAVGAWMYQSIAGIRPDPEYPGFQHFILDPKVGGGLTFARAAYESAYGKIISDWKIENGEFIWKFTIPANTSATVVVRNSSARYESGTYEIKTQLT